MEKNIRKEALNNLAEFVNSDLKNYSNKRNYDFGPNNRKNTSNLSKYITHGIIHEEEIIRMSLAKYKYQEIEKFIQEILWRIYWKGWLEKRHGVWNDYINDLIKLKKKYKNNKVYNDAINSNTNIECFNDWVEELKNFGYLHNHTRMWLASIWIFTLKLPWQLGAEFFLKYLLDGDHASNTLSWRWVAGLQTKGKNYVAESWNIQKFTNNKYKNTNLEKTALPITEEKIYKESFLNFSNDNIHNYQNLVIFENNLSCENNDFFPIFKKIYIVKNLNKRKIEYDPKVLDFKSALIQDQFGRIENTKLTEIIHIDDLKKIDIKKSISLYPNIGENLDFLNENALDLKFIFRKIDLISYKFCNKGYFNFKKNIGQILKSVGI